jgi:hypothetical protein
MPPTGFERVLGEESLTEELRRKLESLRTKPETRERVACAERLATERPPVLRRRKTIRMPESSYQSPSWGDTQRVALSLCGPEPLALRGGPPISLELGGAPLVEEESLAGKVVEVWGRSRCRGKCVVVESSKLSSGIIRPRERPHAFSVREAEGGR